MQLNPLHRGLCFVIVGVGWTCTDVVSIFGEGTRVADTSGMLGVAVGTAI